MVMIRENLLLLWKRRATKAKGKKIKGGRKIITLM